jgi:hypothetical protein
MVRRVGDVGRVSARELRRHDVVVVEPRVIGELDADARVRLLEPLDVVLDCLDRKGPDDEVQVPRRLDILPRRRTLVIAAAAGGGE